jgi:hypothetical protein
MARRFFGVISRVVYVSQQCTAPKYIFSIEINQFYIIIMPLKINEKVSNLAKIEAKIKITISNF